MLITRIVTISKSAHVLHLIEIQMYTFTNYVSGHLKQPLHDYVDKTEKVHLIRASRRSGLIRARLMGFTKCTAPVAIFLDSHCEVTEGMRRF